MNDDELFARLRAADPASSLPPADPSQVARLMEDTMAESRETGTHNRGPLTWLVAAAALAIIAGVGVFVIVNGRGENSSVPVVAAPTVTSLSMGPAPTGKCMVPNASVIANQEIAFAGTVSSLTDSSAVFAVDHWYHGSPTDSVIVAAPPEGLTDLTAAVQFAVGQRYLISATGGNVTLCGFSGSYDDTLAALYAEAFPG